MVLKSQEQKSIYNTCHANPLLKDILLYSKWIGYKKDTAYVFLLRDTLLPYVFFLNQNRENIYPWLISRDFLKQITGSENIDDDIRSPIYEALENGYENFSEFAIFCKRKILSVLDKHPVLKNTLKELMSSLPHKKITVIESGYCGTIPMLLSAVDNRVTFKMFTTAPFLYNTYSKNIFCRKYEKIRLFETLRSQDLLMRYSSYRNKKFYIKIIDNPDVVQESLSEINFFGVKSSI